MAWDSSIISTCPLWDRPCAAPRGHVCVHAHRLGIGLVKRQENIPVSMFIIVYLDSLCDKQWYGSHSGGLPFRRASQRAPFARLNALCQQLCIHIKDHPIQTQYPAKSALVRAVPYQGGYQAFATAPSSVPHKMRPVSGGGI